MFSRDASHTPIEWCIELIECEYVPSARAALHVLVHHVHALVRFEIDADRIETNAFALRERYARVPCAGASTTPDPHNASVCVDRSARDTARNAPARSRSSAARFKNVKFHLALCGPGNRAPIRCTVEHVWRQCREPASYVIA